ncbi:MAG: hypothetical protein KME42_13910 [Tildeniella nuda ZEHNDER 1965/U140]|jgi:hypothetical protein|nr:hypothetical protein [Tildeniella nuda ZEHNDER 1965/U140]
MQSRSKPVVVGGRVKAEEVNAPAEWLEAIAAAMFHIGAQCRRAHKALVDRSSADSDFMTDEEIKDKLDMMHQKYLEAQGALRNQLSEHRALRAIHFNRKAVKRRLQELKEAEDKHLYRREG